MRILLLGLFIGMMMGLGISLQPTQAQTSDTCPAFVEQAVTEVGNICENLGRNVACYGHNNIETSLYQGISFSRFDAPADRIELSGLNSIRTAPLNEIDETWGIALLSVQANLPGTVPGQNVVMMLMGDASLENQVAPEHQISTDETLSVTVNVDANLRDQPSMNSRIIGSVVPNTRLEADMLSEDGVWIRIPQPAGEVVWISRDMVDDNPVIDSLPRPAPTQISPMQSFYFSAGLGQSTCAQASGTLFIQGPNNIRVDLAINGVDISIGSTIALSYISPTQMQVVTLSGTGYVAGVTVPTGYAVTIDLDSHQMGMPETVSAARPMDENSLSRYSLSEAIPTNVLHYHIDLQPVTEVVEQIGNPTVGAVTSGISGPSNLLPNVTNTTTDILDNVTGGMGQLSVGGGDDGLNVDVGVGGLDVGVGVGGDDGINLDLNLNLGDDDDVGWNLHLNLFGH